MRPRSTIIIKSRGIRKFKSEIVAENVDNIVTFGILIQTSKDISLKCGLMIAFLYYAKKHHFYDKAEQFLLENMNPMVNRVLPYFKQLFRDNEIKEYLELEMRKVWYAKRVESKDRENIQRLRTLLDESDLLTFIK